LPVSLKGKRHAGLRQGPVKHRFCVNWENRDRREFAVYAWRPAAIAASGKICRDALGKKRHVAQAIALKCQPFRGKNWFTAARSNPNKDERYLCDHSNQVGENAFFAWRRKMAPCIAARRREPERHKIKGAARTRRQARRREPEGHKKIKGDAKASPF
jgi:hypothetical protein